MIMPVLICAIYFAVLVLIGFTALSLTLGAVREHWALVAGLSFAAGCGCYSLILFITSLLGFLPSRFVLVAVGIAAVVVLAALGLRKRVVRISLPRRPKEFDRRSALAIVAAALIVFNIALVTKSALTPALPETDEYAIWMFRAKMLASEPLRPIPTVLTDPMLSYSHQDYPLGFPLVIAGIFGAVGHVNVMLGKSMLVGVYLSLIVVIYGTIRSMLRRADAIALTAAVTCTPLLVQYAALAVPETYLILQHACCLIMLLRWMQYQRRGDLIAAAAFVAFAAFAKNEGLALLLLFSLVSLVFVVLRRNKTLAIDWACSMAAAAILIAPWLIYRRHLPHTHEDYGGRLTNIPLLLNNLPKAFSILGRFLAHMLRVNIAGVVWPLLVIFAIIGWRAFRRIEVRLLWLLLILHLAIYVMTFMVTPWDLSILIPMVGPRLLMHAIPAAVLLMGLHLHDLRITGYQPVTSVSENARAGSP
jgi:hypothetical protein